MTAQALDIAAVPAGGAEASEPTRARLSPNLPRVLVVIPESADSTFVFARRQVASLQDLGVAVQPFFLGSRQSPAALVAEWKRFRRAVREFDPDFVHAHYGTMTAFFCAVTTDRPLFITFHGSDLNPVPSIPGWRSFTGRLLSQLAALRAAQIVCVSGALRDRLWWRRDRATVIPMGVDLSCFVPVPLVEARRTLGWSADERVVLFNAGRHPAVKRLDLARAAVAAAADLGGPIRFVVADGAAPPGSMPTLMSAADCLLITSDYEGSPTIVKEALACNLPIVSVAVGDVRDRLKGVEPSRIVSRDPVDIGRALAEVLAIRSRSNGRASVRDLDGTKIALRLLAAYQHVRGSSVRRNPHDW
jgi:glycosyltransferase involved in cell wall biosynthesis